MSIIEEKVLVILHTTTFPHYEKLGYIIPRYRDKKGRIKVKYGTKMEINVKDLRYGSEMKLHKKCDFCGNINLQTYQSILNTRDEDGKDFCKKCSLKIFKKTANKRMNNVPFSKSVSAVHPHILLEWNYSLNSKTPDEVSAYSKYKYWWTCKECNSDYDMSPSARCRHNCPFCAGRRVNHTNCLAKTHPDIAEEWHQDKNDKTPFEVKSGSHKHYWWKCRSVECGHVWKAALNSRTCGNGCPKCGVKKRSGENHFKWKGGTTEISIYLRNQLKYWYSDSVKSSGQKCAITDSRYTKRTHDIHHLYGFELIVKETLDETGIEFKDTIAEYTENELNVLSEKCREVHYRYPLGIVLRSDIHQLFHMIYGYGNNVPEQYDEFVERYKKGEFNTYDEIQ